MKKTSRIVPDQLKEEVPTEVLKSGTKKNSGKTAGRGQVKEKPETSLKSSQTPTVKTRKVAAEIVSDSDSDGGRLKKAAGSSLLPDVLAAEKQFASSRELTTSDPVSLYMAEIRKYPLLTRVQEQELAKKYFDLKDPLAAQTLVTSNLRFVVKIAVEYSKFGAKMIDLIQEGNIGLLHAVREFNPYKGVRLITYAVWWIRGYIQEFLMKQYSMVKIGTTQNQKILYYQLKKEKQALESMGEPGHAEALSEKLGIPADEIREMAQRMSRRDLSLDAPLDDENSFSLKDLQPTQNESPDVLLSKKEEISNLKSNIEKLRPDLSPRELILLEERLLADEPLTLQEIGDKYGITREAVRQMEVRLMKKIKTQLEKTAR